MLSSNPYIQNLDNPYKGYVLLYVMHQGYFEGILQLRNATREIMDYVENEISRNKVHLAKTTNLKGGKDYYLGDNKFLLRLGKNLKSKFDGQLVSTSKLFSQNKQTSKEVHRVTVLFRYIPFKVGDIIEYRDRSVEVKRYGTKVEIKDNATNKRELLTYDEFLDRARLL